MCPLKAFTSLDFSLHFFLYVFGVEPRSPRRSHNVIANMSSYLEPESSVPPPAYAACTTESEPSEGLKPEKEPLSPSEELLKDDHELGSTSSQPPPPFSITPGTLILQPHSYVIQGTATGARPFYQLSRPLNGHAQATCLINVPAGRPLGEGGTLQTVRDRDRLYRFYHEHDPLRRHAASLEVVVSGQHRDQFSGVKLRKAHCVGLKGVRSSFTAILADEEGRRCTLYQARPGKGVLEWHDAEGTLVAVETPAVDRRMEEERLEVVLALDRRHLDLIVALWVARIYQDSQEEGAREDKKDAKQRKAEKRQLDKEEGRPTGVLHNMKEALGIGNGLKPGPRLPGLLGGLPAVNENGRINWGGR